MEKITFFFGLIVGALIYLLARIVGLAWLAITFPFFLFVTRQPLNRVTPIEDLKRRVYEGFMLWRMP